MKVNTGCAGNVWVEVYTSYRCAQKLLARRPLKVKSRKLGK